MKNIRVYPYKMGSTSGKQLAQALQTIRVRPDGRFTPRVGQTIINWGSGKIPNWAQKALQRGVKFLNKPEAVNKASNKLTALTVMKAAGVVVPEFTTNMAVAQGWIDENKTVFERHELRGNSGKGIRIVNNYDEDAEATLTAAPLYTKFVPKKKEFRVHVFGGQVFDYAQKKKRGNADARPENFNKYISSTEMGWVFCKTDIEHIEAVKIAAIKATAALGLDFAAVDVMFHKDIAVVLEVNTAPGMAPSTLTNYVTALKRSLGVAITPPATTTVRFQGDGLPGNGQPAQGLTNQIGQDEMVTLTIDKATARKLHALLARFI